jgi:hypothetical protein
MFLLEAKDRDPRQLSREYVMSSSPLSDVRKGSRGGCYRN